ncbi:hypothetical protein DPMN_134791 [Dreissena polymorpha]|uniref:NACHT domain-containing protein n=2 Tax=Dreissena polymorpha TaxID=45954 RepID=A0A9D4G0C9_DREPO|nr:hypothetical protein DPMN_134791 [Dreissena polymorpha]
MLHEGIDRSLTDVHVHPKVFELKRQYPREQTDGQKGTLKGQYSVLNYRDIFTKEGTPSQHIYLQGEPGTGKSTFCTQLLSDWCAAHSPVYPDNKQSNESITEVQGTVNKQPFSDLNILRKYRFLFYVSLRDMRGSECNISRMITNQLGVTLDQHFRQDECLIVSDAADEWTHPPPGSASCQCTNNREFPSENVVGKITFFTTCRPWKLANVRISDTSTRTFEIAGVLDTTLLIEKVFRVCGRTKTDEIRFVDCISERNFTQLVEIPVILMQLIIQWISGYTLSDSRCAIYVNLIDMHLGRALKKHNLQSFDREKSVCLPLPDPMQDEKNVHIKANVATVTALSKLAFYTLFGINKSQAIVFPENSVIQHIGEGYLESFLHTGILTERKSLALNPPTWRSFSFQHKTVQEFLASVYLFMESHSKDLNNSLDKMLAIIKETYGSKDNVLGLEQIFLFTCGLFPKAAEYLSQHIIDITAQHLMEEYEQSLKTCDHVFRDLTMFSPIKIANRLILDGFYEGKTNKNDDLQLKCTHLLNDSSKSFRSAEEQLIEKNKSNIVAFSNADRLPDVLLNKVFKCSGDNLTYLDINGFSSHKEFDFSNLINLQFMYVGFGIVVTNIGARNLKGFFLSNVPDKTEECILKTAQRYWKNSLKYMFMSGCRNVILLEETVREMKSLLILRVKGNSHMQRRTDTDEHAHKLNSTKMDTQKMEVCSLEQAGGLVETTFLRSILNTVNNISHFSIDGYESTELLLRALVELSKVKTLCIKNTKRALTNIDTDVSLTMNAGHLRACTLENVEQVIEKTVLNALSTTGHRIKFLRIVGYGNHNLIPAVLPHLSSLIVLEISFISCFDDTRRMPSSGQENERCLSICLQYCYSFRFLRQMLSVLSIPIRLTLAQQRRFKDKQSTAGSSNTSNIQTTVNIIECRLENVLPLLANVILACLSKNGNELTSIELIGYFPYQQLLKTLPCLSNLEKLILTNAVIELQIEQSVRLMDTSKLIQCKLLHSEVALTQYFLESFGENNTTLQVLELSNCNLDSILKICPRLLNLHKLIMKHCSTNVFESKRSSAAHTHIEPIISTKLEKCKLIQVDKSVEAYILQALPKASESLQCLKIDGCQCPDILLTTLPSLVNLNHVEVVHSLFDNQIVFTGKRSQFSLCLRDIRASPTLLCKALSKLSRLRNIEIENFSISHSEKEKYGLKSLPCVDMSYLEDCLLNNVESCIVKMILESLFKTGYSLKRFQIIGCTYEDLLLMVIPKCPRLIFVDASNLDDAEIYYADNWKEKNLLSLRLWNFETPESILTLLREMPNVKRLRIENEYECASKRTLRQCHADASLPNVQTTALEECTLINVDAILERTILNSLLDTDNKLKRLTVIGCRNEIRVLKAILNNSHVLYLNVDYTNLETVETWTENACFRIRLKNYSAIEILFMKLSQLSNLQVLNIENDAELNENQTMRILPYVDTSKLMQCRLVNVDHIVEKTVLQPLLNKTSGLYTLSLIRYKSWQLVLQTLRHHFSNLHTLHLESNPKCLSEQTETYSNEIDQLPVNNKKLNIDRCCLVNVDHVLEVYILKSLLNCKKSELSEFTFIGCKAEKLLLATLIHAQPNNLIDIDCSDMNNANKRGCEGHRGKRVSVRNCQLTNYILKALPLLSNQTNVLWLENVPKNPLQTVNIPEISTGSLWDCRLVNVNRSITEVVCNALVNTGHMLECFVITGPFCNNYALNHVPRPWYIVMMYKKDKYDSSSFYRVQYGNQQNKTSRKLVREVININHLNSVLDVTACRKHAIRINEKVSTPRHFESSHSNLRGPIPHYIIRLLYVHDCCMLNPILNGQNHFTALTNVMFENTDIGDMFTQLPQFINRLIIQNCVLSANSLKQIIKCACTLKHNVNCEFIGCIFTPASELMAVVLWVRTVPGGSVKRKRSGLHLTYKQ